MAPRWLLLSLLPGLVATGCSSEVEPEPDTAVVDASSDADTPPDDTATTGEDASVVDAGPEVPAPDNGGPPDSGPPDVPDAGPAPVDVPTEPHCENLNPLFCPLPWPSQRWLTPDDSTLTGWRLSYDPDALPQTVGGAGIDVVPYNRWDGFSPSSQLITLFEAPADLSDVAYYDSIEASLAPDHPTVLLDLETGERVAHWVENDARADSAEETLLFIRPASRLAPNRAYGVAIRGLTDSSGAPLAASAAFAALRDGVPTTSGALEARRPGLEALFAALTDAGVERAPLQAAWRFHTASDESTRGTLLAMRADALERLGPDGIGCQITEVSDDLKGTGARRVRGKVTVPWYLDAAAPPASIVRDDIGAPVYSGVEDISFTVIVPPGMLAGSAAGPLITWGHGLFGEADGTISNKSVIAAAEASGATLVATDWHGMSSKDLGFLATALTDVGKFYMVGENLQQGMIIQIALTRTLLGACREVPELLADAGHPVIDPTRRYFIGGSQGSILGGTLLTLSPDIERGALIVGGAAFSFMIERSIHFNKFEPLLTPSYQSRLATGTLMALSQHVWDGAETGGWLGAAQDGLPGVGPKRYVYLIAERDAQVTNLSSDIAARLAGLPVLPGSVRKPWGLTVLDASELPVKSSAYVSFDLGDPATPEGNLSPEKDHGGHGNVGFTAEAQLLVSHFFETGEIIDPCDGPCTIE